MFEFSSGKSFQRCALFLALPKFHTKHNEDHLSNCRYSVNNLSDLSQT